MIIEQSNGFNPTHSVSEVAQLMNSFEEKLFRYFCWCLLMFPLIVDSLTSKKVHFIDFLSFQNQTMSNQTKRSFPNKEEVCLLIEFFGFT